MFHDPDFTPFQSPTRRTTIPKLARNALVSFPASTYDEPFTFEKNYWPFPDLAYVTDPELVEELLITRADEFPRDYVTRQVFAAELDRGSLFLAEGAEWRWQRRAVAPVFRHENLLGFAPIFAACARRCVELWRKRSLDGPLDMSAAMTQTTFDIIIDAVLGGASELDRGRYLEELARAFQTMIWLSLLAGVGLPASFPHPGRARAHRAANHVYAEVAKLVAARKAAPCDRKDVLNLLIGARDPESGRTMSDVQIIANLAVFIAAGHETSAVALAWTLWLLAKDRASQERVRAEAVEAAGDGDFDASNVEKLVFTRQVAQEAMRLFPPFSAIVRQPKEDTMLGPYRVSKKTRILVPLWSLHRHKKLWDEPCGFEPERFAPEAVKARHRCAYLPFGAGPRICIGMNFAMLEIVTILATLVREFRLSPAPGFKLELVTPLTLRSKNGLPLVVEPIRAAS